MIGHDIKEGGRALEIMLPVLEHLKDGEQLLIMGIIVELQQGECAGVEGDQAEFVIGAADGEDASSGIVRCVGLHNQQSIRNPMGKDRSCSKGILETEEGEVTLWSKLPRGILVSESSEWDNDVGVVEYETTVEVGEAKKGQNVLHLTGLRPIGDGLYLVGGHGQAIGRQLVAQVFNGGGMELTLLQFGVEAVVDSKMGVVLTYRQMPKSSS